MVLEGQMHFILGDEDRIVGPLTIRQFGYIGAAAGIAFVLYFMLPMGLWAVLALLLLLIGGAFAFLKINGRPFTSFVKAFLLYYWNSQQYVWQPEHPALPKSALKETAGESFSIEKIVSGLALKNAWHTVQTGSVFKEEKPRAAPQGTERYQIFRAATGEKRAAKRIDYK